MTAPVSGVPTPRNTPLLVAVAAVVVGVGSPLVAVRVWSTTRWRPDGVRGLVELYVHGWYPERVPGTGLHGPAFALTTLTIAVTAAVVGGWVAARVARRGRARRRGLACRADLVRFSPAAIVARSAVILGARDRNPAHAGVMVGRERYTGRAVWLPKESTLLVLAPPRSGKTSGTVAPAVIDHHGPVVATGVRDDILRWTHPWRTALGAPMWVCEPMRTPDPLPAGVGAVRWSPLAGCTDMVTARLRAEALFAALSKGGRDDEYWRTAGQSLLAGYLMAAARMGGRISDVLGWVDRDTDTSPVEVLRSAAAQLTDPADALDRASLGSVAAQMDAAIGQDPRYRAGVTGQALQALEPFRLPAIRQMCDIPLAESFDPAEFLASGATIWMLGSESHQRQAAGVCTALTAAIVEQARQRARELGGRLRPPLLLALDEAVNVAPIPRLEQLLSTGGGSGIQTIVVLQSMAAARNAWGREMGDALKDFNNAKIVLGGLADAQDLEDLSKLLGVRDEVVMATSHRASAGVLTAGDASYSWRQVPVLRADEIRELDSEHRGEALLIARSAKGIILVQDRIFNRTPPESAVTRRPRRATGARSTP